MNEEMSEESISTIIQLKNQQLTEKYNKLYTATRKQETMNVFFWGGIAFLFLGMFLKNQMSTSVEVIWGIVAFCSTIYAGANMPNYDELRNIEEEIEIAKREIKDLEEQENTIENASIISTEETTRSNSEEDNISSTSKRKTATNDEAQNSSWLKKLYRP